MDFLKGEILYLDKPLGWTSFDLVKRVRGALTRRLHVKKIKVGHAGTLDPLATGVVLIVTGKATSRIEELQAGVKEYIATIAIGATTPSFDLETEVDATYPTEHITEDLVRQTLPQFLGCIEQIPPAYSAIKIDGKRAYEMARKGKEPQLKPKILVIDELELLSYRTIDATEASAGDEVESRLVKRHDSALQSQAPLVEIKLRIVCSKGTYIRALARDIGQALNSGAHLTALKRTRVGNATLDKCLSIDEMANLIATCPIPEKDTSPSSEGQNS